MYSSSSSSTLELAKRLMEGDPSITFCQGQQGGGCPPIQRFTCNQTFMPIIQENNVSIPLLVAFNPLAGTNSVAIYAEPTLSNSEKTIYTSTTNPFFVADQVPGKVITLTLGNELLIPLPVGENIQVSPSSMKLEGANSKEVPVAYAVGRIVSGEIHVRSNQTSITMAALSGTISAGITNCFANLVGLSSSKIRQGTVLKKESILHTSIQNGVRTIVGPDVLEESKLLERGFYAPQLTQQIRTYPRDAQTGTLTISSNYGSDPYFVWVSPEKYCTMVCSGGINSATIAIPPNHPQCNPTLRVGLKTLGIEIPSSIPVLHFYVNFSLMTPGIETFILTESVQLPFDNGIAVNPVLDTATVGYTTRIVQVQQTCDIRVPQKAGYLWVGSMLPISATSAIQGASGSLSLAELTVLYDMSPWTTGPTRLLRVENVANNQQVVVTGTLTAEVNPLQDTAPFIHGKAETVLSFEQQENLRRLFNDDYSSAKRIFTSTETESDCEGVERKRKRELNTP